MSGIYIKNIEKPVDCSKCPMRDRRNERCVLHRDEYETWEEEYKSCPIIGLAGEKKLFKNIYIARILGQKWR